jgi:two-component system chemotaxis response regulator CheY
MTKRVLIADDSCFMRKALEQYLSDSGYRVVGIVGNGEDAVDQYKTLLPDLITLDIVMPILDGIEATRRIKKFDPKAKILICSSLERQTLINQALSAGADEFISKPINKKTFLRALKKLIS